MTVATIHRMCPLGFYVKRKNPAVFLAEPARLMRLSMLRISEASGHRQSEIGRAAGRKRAKAGDPCDRFGYVRVATGEMSHNSHGCTYPFSG